MKSKTDANYLKFYLASAEYRCLCRNSMYVCVQIYTDVVYTYLFAQVFKDKKVYKMVNKMYYFPTCFFTTCFFSF